MPKCFIIMPLTTRAELLPVYDGDMDHFIHVLEHFLVPSVQAAGFEPVRPIAEGSEIIHARIISKLSDADMVLCDMSALNPNVFFELGIRTALNKPTCIIKDDATKQVPFDTSIINYHTYASKLMAWNIESEKTKLTTHITKSVDAEKPGNAMWRHFGLSHAAHLPTQESGADARLDYLTAKMDQLSKQIEGEQRIQHNATIHSDLAREMLVSLLAKEGSRSTALANMATKLGLKPATVAALLDEGAFIPPHVQDLIEQIWEAQPGAKKLRTN